MDPSHPSIDPLNNRRTVAFCAKLAKLETLICLKAEHWHSRSTVLRMWQRCTARSMRRSASAGSTSTAANCRDGAAAAAACRGGCQAVGDSVSPLSRAPVKVCIVPKSNDFPGGTGGIRRSDVLKL